MQPEQPIQIEALLVQIGPSLEGNPKPSDCRLNDLASKRVSNAFPLGSLHVDLTGPIGLADPCCAISQWANG